jgi:hypothetical protein
VLCVLKTPDYPRYLEQRKCGVGESSNIKGVERDLWLRDIIGANGNFENRLPFMF